MSAVLSLPQALLLFAVLAVIGAYYVNPLRRNAHDQLKAEHDQLKAERDQHKAEQLKAERDKFMAKYETQLAVWNGMPEGQRKDMYKDFAVAPAHAAYTLANEQHYATFRCMCLSFLFAPHSDDFSCSDPC